MLSRLCLCAHRPRKHCFGQRLEGAARLAEAHLRSRVTIPAEVEEHSNSQALIDSAKPLPRVHCAFRACTGKFEEDERTVREAEKVSAGLGGDREPAESFADRVLKAHILREHKEQIQSSALVEDENLWDVYKEALAAQERHSVPVVGAAVDRRAFQSTLEVYKDDRIQALICFCCARVCLNTGGCNSEIGYRPGSWLLRLPPGAGSRV